MKHLTYSLLLLATLSTTATRAQTYAQLKVWDSHERHPKINEIEFQGGDSAIATYDAIYGHGSMMENECYALRVYMDQRQCVDLYGKRSPEPELSVTDFYSTPDLINQGYGEDILFVGSSIGAGTLQGWREGKPQLIEPVAARGQRVTQSTPEASSFEVWDKGWLYAPGITLNMRQRYSMASGERATTVDVWIEDALTGSSEGLDTLLFATGVQKLEQGNQSLTLPEQGLVATWGTNEPEKIDKPGVTETLGIAVTVPAEHLQALAEDSLSHFCIVHPVGGHIRYRLEVAPDMQQVGGFHTAEDWFAHLRATYCQ